MSVKQRLTCMGNKKRSFFRIVATNTASRRDGRLLEFLGHYNPQVSLPTSRSTPTRCRSGWTRGRDDDTVRSLMKQYAEGRRLVRLSVVQLFARPGRFRVGSGRCLFMLL